MTAALHKGASIVWGSAGHAKVLASILRAQERVVVALFDNRAIESALPGIPLHVGMEGLETWLASHDASQHGAFVAIGGHRGRDRVDILRMLRSRGFDTETLIHEAASVDTTAHLGAGCQVLAQAVVAADASVGEGCIINHRANVDHECVLGAGVHLAPGATLCGVVTVGDYAMVGAGAVVLPRITIGSGAVVGAGAVVTRNVPDGAVVVGNPARALIDSKGIS